MRKLNFDVVVVGAGASGVAAAVRAGRSGVSVCLLERGAVLGGLASSARVGTICGLYEKSPVPSERAGDFALEFAERLCAYQKRKDPMVFQEDLYFLPIEAAFFETVCADLIAETSHVTTMLHATCHAVAVRNWKIDSVNALAWNESLRIGADAFVDATGEGLLSSLAEAEMLADHKLQAPGYVFCVSGVDTELDEKTLNLLVLKELVTAGKCEALPEPAPYFSVVPGSCRNGMLEIKLSFPFQRTGEFNEITRFELLARKAAVQGFQYLRSNVASFAAAELGFLAPTLGVRSGPRGRGKHVLSATEVRSSARFEDAIASGLWPIEYWSGNRRASIEKLPGYYEIPARALISSSYDNLFFCGRGISADAEALSSARVIATSFATGSAAGKLAGAV